MDNNVYLSKGLKNEFTLCSNIQIINESIMNESLKIYLTF